MSRITNWADISDDEFDSDESPNPSQNLPHQQKRNSFSGYQQEKSQKLPVRFQISNLPNQASTSQDIFNLLLISESDKKFVRCKFIQNLSGQTIVSLEIFKVELSQKVLNTQNSLKLTGIQLKKLQGYQSPQRKIINRRSVNTKLQPPQKPNLAKFESSNCYDQHGRIVIPPSITKIEGLNRVQVKMERKSNPFGEARPIDTRNKEKEFDQKINWERDQRQQQQDERPAQPRWQSLEYKQSSFSQQKTRQEFHGRRWSVCEQAESPQVPVHRYRNSGEYQRGNRRGRARGYRNRY